MSTRIATQASGMRKEPQQQRSRATVEAIVQAGTRILGAEGWAGFTTNRVADVAGVSIGSLYQYFPDKDSLVDAIRRRHLDDCLSVMQQPRSDELSAEQYVRDLIGNMIAVHSIHPGLHRVLLDEAPSSDEYRNPNSDFEIRYLACYAELVACCRTGRAGRPTDADQVVAVIISDAVDGVIHNAARRGTLGNPQVQEELVRLISLYLAAGPMANRSQGSRSGQST